MRPGAARDRPADGRAGARRCTRRVALRALAGAVVSPALAACPWVARPLRIAAHVWPGYELLFLAAREGWLSRSDVEMVETGSATDSLGALLDERVDAAALTLDEVLRVRVRGLALGVVLVLDVSSGADVVLAREGIRSPADLRGKRIGVEASAVGALMLHHVLRRGGLQPEAVRVVPLTGDTHVHAWRAGRVEALVTYEPSATQLEAEGAVRVFDSRQVPGAIVDVLAATPAALARLRRPLRATVAAHFVARRHLVQSRQDAAYRMSRHLRLSAPQVLDAYRWLNLPDEGQNRRLLGGASPQLLVAARELSAVMVAAGLLPAPDSLEGLLRPEFLPEATP